MKCQVCGAESGKYPICRDCNRLKEQGQVVKCEKCGRWHRTGEPCACPAAENAALPAESEKGTQEKDEKYLYEPKTALVTRAEQGFMREIAAAVPAGYFVFPQINLAAFIERTDDAKYRSELFRNVDFLVTDAAYAPKLAVEINDSSHLEKDRRRRDEKVHGILEEAGIPLLTLWTSYGVNGDYIRKRVQTLLNAPPARRHVFAAEKPEEPPQTAPVPAKKKGCYIATCVYGSYDCPAVWTLRRYRDTRLAATRHGRAFIRLYYAVSPVLVRLFGRSKAFRRFWGRVLDGFVQKLRAEGLEDGPYCD